MQIAIAATDKNRAQNLIEQIQAVISSDLLNRLAGAALPDWWEFLPSHLGLGSESGKSPVPNRSRLLTRCNIKKILENRIIAETLFKFKSLLIVSLGTVFNFKFSSTLSHFILGNPLCLERAITKAWLQTTLGLDW